MTKRKKKVVEAVIHIGAGLDAELLEVEKEVMMRSAAIVGTNCHYSFEALQSNPDKGYHAGTIYPVKPKNTIVKQTFLDVMEAGRVHLASLDDAFLRSGIDDSNLAAVEDHELVESYKVNGIQLKGKEGSYSVIITGDKYSATARGWVELDIPVIIEEHGQYKHRDLFKHWVDEVMKEAEAYMHGNYDLEEPEEIEDPAQTKLQFAEGESTETETETKESPDDEDF